MERYDASAKERIDRIILGSVANLVEWVFIAVGLMVSGKGDSCWHESVSRRHPCENRDPEHGHPRARLIMMAMLFINREGIPFYLSL